jgi:hypothetical protein
MSFEVEFTDEFGAWWDGLDEAEQDSVDWSVRMLRTEGPALNRPYVDTLKGSRFPNLKELRVQHEGRPYRVFFAFDPRRMCMLLIGGDKTGNNRFYAEMVPKAEAIYAQHLSEIGYE